MEHEGTSEVGIIAGENDNPPEEMVLGKERWEQIRRGHTEERLSVSELARRFAVDRKTVRKALRMQWKRYERAVRKPTLLSEHAEFLSVRAAEVDYSAQILYQNWCAIAATAAATRQ